MRGRIAGITFLRGARAGAVIGAAAMSLVMVYEIRIVKYLGSPKVAAAEAGPFDSD